jgi:hypothetical protein
MAAILDIKNLVKKYGDLDAVEAESSACLVRIGVCELSGAVGFLGKSKLPEPLLKMLIALFQNRNKNG